MKGLVIFRILWADQVEGSTRPPFPPPGQTPGISPFSVRREWGIEIVRPSWWCGLHLCVVGKIQPEVLGFKFSCNTLYLSTSTTLFLIQQILRNINKLFFFPQLQQCYFQFNDFLSTSTPLSCEFQHWNEPALKSTAKTTSKRCFLAARSTLVAIPNAHPHKRCQNQQLYYQHQNYSLN